MFTMSEDQDERGSAILAGLAEHLGRHLSEEGLRRIVPVARKYPFAVTSHWASLITGEGDPLWRQCVPDPRELAAPVLEESPDPLAEVRFSPLPGLVHRYRDRVLLLLTARCAAYCRFCTRKHRLGRGRDGAASLERALPWLRAHPEIRDVLLSGGDPFTLAAAELVRWVRALRELPQLALIRIGTRLPSFAPERIGHELCGALAPFAPLYINTHFNHPQEITPATRAACERMRAAGMILSNQTVLLRSVNDDAALLRELFYALLSIGVRPYYLHMLDHVAGASHFRVPLSRAAAIWDELAAATSGMALPRLMIDLPGGGGKIQYMRTRVLHGREPHADAPAGGDGKVQYVFRNIEGGESIYMDTAGEPSDFAQIQYEKSTEGGALAEKEVFTKSGDSVETSDFAQIQYEKSAEGGALAEKENFVERGGGDAKSTAREGRC